MLLKNGIIRNFKPSEEFTELDKRKPQLFTGRTQINIKNRPHDISSILSYLSFHLYDYKKYDYWTDLVVTIKFLIGPKKVLNYFGRG